MPMPIMLVMQLKDIDYILGIYSKKKTEIWKTVEVYNGVHGHVLINVLEISHCNAFLFLRLYTQLILKTSLVIYNCDLTSFWKSL